MNNTRLQIADKALLFSDA